MTLSVIVPAEVEDKLREQAAARGEAIDAYASRLLVEAVRAPSIDLILSPFRQRVAASNKSDAELEEYYESLRSEVWRDMQRGKS